MNAQIIALETEAGVFESSELHRGYRHDFSVQAARSATDDQVFFSTFQRGRGQHITSLTREEAWELGRFLTGLA